MIVLGLDPGAQTGWCVLEASGGTAPLPWQFRYVNGGSIRFELEVDSNEAKRQAGALMNRCAPDLVVVEWVAGIAFPSKGAGIVPNLISAAGVAGWLFGVAQSWCATKMLTARQARSLVFGKSNASDVQIGLQVTQRIQNWPRRSTSHVKDAAVVAMAGAMLARRVAA